MLIEQDSPTRFLRTHEAASFLGLSPRTLEKHRTFGTGPRYVKLGGRVVYKIVELQSWAERGVRKSTSDPGLDTILPAKPRDPEMPETTRGTRKLSRRNSSKPKR
jgi:predicted DNA-binding transcriptional regulator AlpA